MTSRDRDVLERLVREIRTQGLRCRRPGCIAIGSLFGIEPQREAIGGSLQDLEAMQSRSFLDHSGERERQQFREDHAASEQ